MSDDPILDELAKVAREDHARSGELERVHDGAPPDDDEEAAFVRSVLAAGNDDALVTAAMNALGSKSEPTAPAPADVARRERTIERQAGPPDVKVGRPRPERARVVAFIGGAVALAAGILLYVKQAERAIDLPGYEAILEGTDAPDRATPHASTKVSRGAGLTLVARPKKAVARRLEGAAFGACGGALKRLPARVEVAATGAARVDGTPESLFGAGASGTCTLAIVVAAEGRLPERLDDLRDDVRVVEATFVVQE